MSRSRRRSRPGQVGPGELHLTGRASRFLQLLQDFGHLDEEGVAHLLLSVGAMRPADDGSVLDLPELRRVAAITLFGQHEGQVQDGLLAEDWALMFS